MIRRIKYVKKNCGTFLNWTLDKYILFCKIVKKLNHSKQVLDISSTTIRIKYAKKCNSYFKKLNHGKYSYEI